jgi:hypothetical protein
MALALAEASAPTTKTISYILLRPRIMLVRVDDAEQTAGWGLEELGVDVLRVRHPLPACARMHVTRPKIVILGEDIRPIDVAFIKRTAREIGAKIVQLGPLIAREAMPGWIRGALDEAQRSTAQPALHLAAV